VGDLIKTNYVLVSNLYACIKCYHLYVMRESRTKLSAFQNILFTRCQLRRFFSQAKHNKKYYLRDSVSTIDIYQGKLISNIHDTKRSFILHSNANTKLITRRWTYRLWHCMVSYICNSKLTALEQCAEHAKCAWYKQVLVPSKIF
jgi:hypothetical protein